MNMYETRLRGICRGDTRRANLDQKDLAERLAMREVWDMANLYVRVGAGLAFTESIADFRKHIFPKYLILLHRDEVQKLLMQLGKKEISDAGEADPF